MARGSLECWALLPWGAYGLWASGSKRYPCGELSAEQRKQQQHHQHGAALATAEDGGGLNRFPRSWDDTVTEVVRLKGEFMRTLACALLALGWAVSGSVAQADDGNKLLEICKAPERTVSRANCLGFVVGVQQTLTDLAYFGALNGPPCIRDGVTPSQMADVVVTYLAENPKERNWSAAALVASALKKAWPPCNNPEK